MKTWIFRQGWTPADYAALAVSVGVLLWVWGTLVPASWYYEPDTVYVEDTFHGEPPVMVVERRIHRTFLGRFTAIVREAPTSTSRCTSHGVTNYRPDAQLPHLLTLDWWAPDCSDVDLRPGRYYVDTCWEVLDAFWGLVPVKRTCKLSNIFKVEESRGGR